MDQVNPSTQDGSGTFDNPNSIGNWDVSQLQKFIRDMQEQNPSLQLQLVQSETIIATSELQLKDKVTTPAVNNSFRYVSKAGQPPFTNSYTANATATAESASFVKDIFGMVRLGGRLTSPNPTTTNSAFTLPPGYRPSLDRAFVVTTQAGTAAQCKVGSDGTVSFPSGLTASQWVSLDGIQFRAK